MLIRSSFISLVLAATLTSAAHCDSTSEAPAPQETPAPVPTPTPAPVPTPTPDPIPEAPQRVELKLLPYQSACGHGYKVTIEEAGAIQVHFDDLISEASQGRYSASCRLAGELVIPKGYRLDPSVMLTAVVKGDLKGPIDNVTGRLKFGLGRYIHRDFQLAEYKETENANQSVKIELKTQVPELPGNCSEDTLWPVSLFVESTINGTASSRIEQLRLDSLNLLPLDCTMERKKS